jgi:hypothetical protein
MAIVAVRGKGIHHYLKEGYNVVRRYQKGESPDEINDCFEFLLRCKTQTQAEKQIKKFSGKIEIIEFKTNEPRTKSK